MAVEVGSAYVTIWPKLEGSTWASEINSAIGGIKTDSAGKQIGESLGSGVGSGLSAAKVAIGNILADAASAGINAIRSSLDSAISRVDTLNQFPKVMSNIGFSTDEAKESISKLSDGIQGLPTTLDGIVANTQAFALSLGDLGQATDVALAVNDGMLAFGASSEGASEAVRQLNQMIANGTYDMQSWQSINSQAPGLLDTVAQSMLGVGANAGTLRDALNSGQIGTQDFLNALVQLDTQGGQGIASFAETARMATGGIQTSMDNVQSAIVKNVGNIINAFNGENGSLSAVFDGLKAGINGLGTALTPVAEVIGTLFSGISAQFSEFMTAFNERCSVFAEAFRSTFEESHNVALAFVTGLQEAFNGTVLQGLFDGLAGAVQRFLDTMQNGGSAMDGIKAAIGELPAPITALGTALAGVASSAAFGLIASKTNSMVSMASGAFSKISTAVGGFVSSIAQAGGGISGLGQVLTTALGGPVGIVVAALAALAAAMVYLYNTNEQFRASMQAVGEQLMSALQPALEAIGSALSNMASAVLPLITNMIQMLAPVLAQIITVIGQLASAILPAIASVLATIIPIITQVVTSVMEVANQLISFLVPIIQQICDFISANMPMIQSVIEGVMNAVLAVVQAVWPVVQSVIETAMNVIQGVIQTVSALIQGDWEGVWNGIMSIAQSIWDGICNIVEAAINAVAEIIGGVLDAIGSAWDSAWQAIGDFIQTIWDGICNAVQSAIDAVASAIDATLSAIQSTWESVWTAVGDFLQTCWDGICNACSTAIDNVINFFSDLPGNILNALGDLGSLLIDAGKQIIDGLLTGLQNAVGAVWDFVSGIGSTIASLKGPKRYDLRLLIPAGNWIMQSLETGLDQGMDGVRNKLRSITNEIQAFDAEATIETQADVKYQISSMDAQLGALADPSLYKDTNLSKADVVDAMTEAMRENTKDVNLYIDGKKVASATADYMDVELATRQRRKQRV